MYVDYSTCIVKIPKYIVLEALRKASRKFVLYGKDLSKSIIIDSVHYPYFVVDSSTFYVLDLLNNIGG